MLINRILDDVMQQELVRVAWPKQDEYRNSETNRLFVPQNDLVRKHVFETDSPHHLYFKSGEGAGKTATLSVLILNKLRRGLTGAFVCVDMMMLSKVWKEFKRWIPWDCVIPDHRHMASEAWSPYRGYFEIVFYAENGGTSTLSVGGLGQNYGKWESLNLNFFAGDEFRHVPDAQIMKIAGGRTRVVGPRGEPSQIVIGSTPTFDDHWMYDYFGPIQGDDDPLLGFKQELAIVELNVEENEGLEDWYVKGGRALTLTENEKKVYIEGKWGSAGGDKDFLPSMEMWDRLYEPRLTPPRRKNDVDKNFSDALVVAMDGAIKKDSFALCAVSRSPFNRNDVAVRLVREFRPKGKGVGIDFVEVENTIRDWCNTYNIVTIVFDIYQIYDMTERLRKDGIAWLQEFSQQTKRNLSDNLLYELILQGRVIHSNQPELRQHIKNAGHTYDSRNAVRRIVKKRENLKIDLVISLGMAAMESIRLNL